MHLIFLPEQCECCIKLTQWFFFLFLVGVCSHFHSIEGEGGADSQVNKYMSSGDVLQRGKQGGRRILMESLLDDLIREGLLMTFKWRSKGCEGLSPEVSREKTFQASGRITDIKI